MISIQPETAYDNTFQRIQPLAIRLVENATARSNVTLRRALRLALADQDPTEYPYIFRNSFLGREPSRPVVDVLSAAVHLIQTSTFVIDDIFDVSRRRNGNPTIFAEYGHKIAMVVGEILQCVGFSTLASIGDRARLRNVSRAVAALSEAITLVYRGQYLDLLYSADLRTTRAQYYRLIRYTTGSLLAGSARCGALLANRTAAEIEALSRFAHSYGMALQVTDDVLDITDETTGKTFGSDLRCRRMRLPLMIALERGSRRDRATLRKFFAGTRRDHRTVAEAAEVIHRSGGVDGAVEIARRYCAQSLQALATIRTGPQKDALAWLPESLLADQELEEESRHER